MIIRRIVCLLCVAMLGLCVGALAKENDPFENLDGTLSIAGSSAPLPFLQHVARDIMDTHPLIRIIISGGGSDEGIQQVSDGLLDIGISSRPLSLEETLRYSLTSYRFALDGIAIIVNPGNFVKALTTAQVRNIFTGAYTSWLDLGGTEENIRLFERETESGMVEAFSGLLSGRGRGDNRTTIVTSSIAMRQGVSKEPAAIGYLSLGLLDKTVSGVILDGIAPTPANAYSGRYPLVRYMYMHTTTRPNALTLAFIKYMSGASAKALLPQYGFLPVKDLVDRDAQ